MVFWLFQPLPLGFFLDQLPFLLKVLVYVNKNQQGPFLKK